MVNWFTKESFRFLLEKIFTISRKNSSLKHSKFFVDNFYHLSLKGKKFISIFFFSQEERFIEMVSPKEDGRYSNERNQSHGYYDDRSIHYYRDIRDERDLLMSSNNGSTNAARHSQESSESDRGN